VRLPTANQAELLRFLAPGGALIVADGRARQCVRWGWLAPEHPEKPDVLLRITPDGLRTLAAVLERDGHGSLRGEVERVEPVGVRRLRIQLEDERAAHRTALARERALELALGELPSERCACGLVSRGLVDGVCADCRDRRKAEAAA
jgi:hypothetical protein